MLEFKEVVFRRGRESVFNGLSFSLEAGSFTGLAGENGAGKSTLCRLAAALLLPDSGSVLSAGRDSKSRGGLSFASWTGFLFQNPDRQLCKSRVRDEVLFSLEALGQDEEEARSRIDPLLDFCGLDPEAEIFPLSRGARQLTALASVLIRRPSLLLLDEPTSGLDNRQRELTVELLRAEKKRGTTILMVTHDMELAEELCDELLLLSAGQIKDRGPVSHVIDSAARRQELRRTELRELGARLGGAFAEAERPEDFAALIEEKIEGRVA